MSLQQHVDKVESLAQEAINLIIDEGYDVEPMINGMSSSLKDEVELWLKMHDNFFISWAGTKEPAQRYTLFINQDVWYINLTNQLYPVRVTVCEESLCILELAYANMRKEYMSTVLVKAADTAPSVELDESVNIVANIENRLKECSNKIITRCHSFINAFLKTNGIDAQLTDIAINVKHPEGGFLQCVTPIGTITSDKCGVHLTSGDNDPILISNLHTTLGVNMVYFHLLTVDISNAFSEYETVYDNNEAWLLLNTTLSQHPFIKSLTTQD